MRYMGGKVRIAKYLLPIIITDRVEGQYYVEPFCDGCNVIDKVTGPRIANDSHPYLIHMWKALVEQGWQPGRYTREQYKAMMANPELYPKHEVGWAGFCCSYQGCWSCGYLSSDSRDWHGQAVSSIMKQVNQLAGVEFHNVDYKQLVIPDGSIVYCDPPYKGVSSYELTSFNHDEFWEWVRQISKNNTVYISEHNAPDDFECMWSQEVKNFADYQTRTERLFKVSK